MWTDTPPNYSRAHRTGRRSVNAKLLQSRAKCAVLPVVGVSAALLAASLLAQAAPRTRTPASLLITGGVVVTKVSAAVR
jgi:hypothetical protein